MTERAHLVGGGGMTGATGELTPDDADVPFVPGELREFADPVRANDVTEAQAGTVSAGEFDDVAFRFERHSTRSPEEVASSARRAARGPTQSGADRVADHEERF